MQAQGPISPNKSLETLSPRAVYSESKARLNCAQCFDFSTVMVVPWSSRDLIPCPKWPWKYAYERDFASDCTRVWYRLFGSENIKADLSCALICAFDITYAKCKFSHDAAQIYELNKIIFVTDP